jgi:hypothetical protein
MQSQKSNLSPSSPSGRHAVQRTANLRHKILANRFVDLLGTGQKITYFDRQFKEIRMYYFNIS